MFVFVRDAKPKRCVCYREDRTKDVCLQGSDTDRRPDATAFPACRKVAVPVPDGCTWAEFLSQVRGKLKISGIREVYLASVGPCMHEARQHAHTTSFETPVI